MRSRSSRVQPLIDRELEKAELARLVSADGAKLALLYGRRRVGKTFLLDRAWEEEKVFYFLAADSTPAMNRADLVRDISAWTRRDLDPADFPSWRTVFRLIAQLARDGAIVVVLDEFQYLLGGDDDAASQLVAVWDREIEGLPLTLVLCGSEVSTLERLQGADQPLYGRLDWSHRLRAFDYFDAARMIPDRSPNEATQFYGVFGGTPQYRAGIAAGEPLSEAASRMFLPPGGPVRVQLENIIEQEKGIRRPADYRAVLSAIARGRTGKNEIATTAGMSGRSSVLRHILDRLEDLGLVWREQNFAAPRNAPFRYRVSDNAVRFWYRFVDPNRSALETGNPKEVWKQQMEPYLGSYMGRVFEGLCREAFCRFHDQWDLPMALQWGRWEGRDRNRQSVEIDVAARLTDGRLLTGEVKWSSSPVGASIHASHIGKLTTLAASRQGWAHEALPEGGSSHYIYFSAAGFGDDMIGLAQADPRISLVALEQLYSRE